MVVFPNCKINIGLQVTGKREDGFHDLETVFYPLAIKDALEIVPATGTSSPVSYTSSGNEIDGNIDDNLCVRAYYLLKKDFPLLPPVQMHLHKAIPSGAGLGGGSADAACTLQLLAKLFELAIPDERLAGYALQLGSDCPFFLVNKPAIGKGRGENLEPVSLDLGRYNIQVVHPGIHVNTGQAFSLLRKDGSKHTDLRAAIENPVETWKEQIFNDFETPVFATYPEIKKIKDYLYDIGALYASLSGSGSSVFGIFAEGRKPAVNFPAHYFCKLV
ncbi:4-(cytidine 5'-diphospho)-2-C-methyl-D-erythritol kinase [Ferruginibacter sp. HRS2-29]|uniref:4-(cytidine 5'-diphospho)-2-C-methyl-D-erythritol kinase n=1 Tax=Ferruginibacter sp. HRS2-29 TaxID=2487334 RepID=UPI0020CBC7D2|nr:4-(cytidine 5'-diphospho)-2-C-methyl-D-erythritol kinase [Ferruginibacter sp. HRS2-29]